MTCDEVLLAIDLIAAGELAPDARTAAHLSSCASCAATLEAQRRLEALLRERPVAAPPAQFTSRTMARIRRARWRNEQMIDWGFNAVLAVAALLVAVAIGVVVSRSGVFVVGNDAIELFNTGVRNVLRRMTASLPLYALAAALLATALGVWWWAERDDAPA